MLRSAILIHLLLYSLLISSTGCTKDPSDIQANGSADTGKSTRNAQVDSVKVTFVELGSVNCIPCKMMQPIMEAIEDEYAGQVNVVFHDVWTEEGQPYAEEYGIRVIPTQIFLDMHGKEYFRHEGFFPKEELVEVLKQKGVH